MFCHVSSWLLKIVSLHFCVYSYYFKFYSSCSNQTDTLSIMRLFWRLPTILLLYLRNLSHFIFNFPHSPFGYLQCGYELICLLCVCMCVSCWWHNPRPHTWQVSALHLNYTASPYLPFYYLSFLLDYNFTMVGTFSFSSLYPQLLSLTSSSSFFFFLVWLDWNLNSGFCTCKAGTLLLEPHLHSVSSNY
jgi:hypothetical protein